MERHYVMDELSRLTGFSECILRGHFVLPDGRHSDTSFDLHRALENPGMVEPLLFDLSNQLGLWGIERVTGASTAGLVIASQVSMRLRVPFHALEFDKGVRHVNPDSRIEAARLAIVDAYVWEAQRFDAVIRALRSKGADVVALGAMVAMPFPLRDLPLEAFCVALTLDARVFSADSVPDWLALIPVQDDPH